MRQVVPTPVGESQRLHVNPLNPGINGILLEPVTNASPPDNFTTRSESMPLERYLHLILSKKWKRGDFAWDGKEGSGSGPVKEHLATFADQIESKAKEVTSTASVLLEDFFEWNSSSSLGFNDLDDAAATLGDFFVPDALHDALAMDGDDWLRGIQKDASIIESWEVEAKKLAQVANAAFQNLKRGTKNAMENATSNANTELATNADRLYHEMQRSQKHRRLSERQDSLKLANPLLLSNQTWESGGVIIEASISPEFALETIIKSMPLKTYKLRDDKQHDLGVKKDERRTRYHVGVIQGEVDDQSFDSSSIFSYNVGAISQLAISLDMLSSKIAVSVPFLGLQSSLNDKLSQLKAVTKNQNHSSFKSPSQVASEVAALETEAALTRISLLSQSLLQSIRMNLIDFRLMQRLRIESRKGQSKATLAVIEQDLMLARENRAEDSEAYLDQLLIHFEAIDKIKTLWNSTKRELLEMDDAAAIESHVAQEEIHAEAEVERENEAANLEQIRLKGKIRIAEIIDVIERIFLHLIRCGYHVLTPKGREQFIFYVGVTAVLYFVVSTTKELIALGCTCALRFFTAPRLVREYGNLGYRTRNNSRVTKSIVLHPKIKSRMKFIVKVASAASERRFPLRSVLLTGPSGCGKSMAAKEIALSSGLPYALMSGADVFPMGSQGPAELRKLLEWASKKRHGAIVIIDEAESALKTRTKGRPRNNEGTSRALANGGKSSNPGFSCDCLNVLLSMTGSFGNIMLILTTSRPKELDEAVLDRMDEIVHLPLPSAKDRVIMLQNQFDSQFERENDQPRSFKSPFSPKSVKAPFHSNFDKEKCMHDLAADSKTSGLSFRELEKLVRGVLYKTYASGTALDTVLWERETSSLIKTILNKRALK